MKKMYAIVAIQIAIVLFLGIGWIKCAIKLYNCDFSNETSYKPEIVYGLGLVSGVGGVIGWLDLGK